MNHRHRRHLEAGRAGRPPPCAFVRRLLDRRHVGHAAELADIGAGDEAAALGRPQHEALRRIALELAQHVVELDQHLLGQRVGARALLVDHEPGDAVVVARELPMPPRASGCAERRPGQAPGCAARERPRPSPCAAPYTVSISMAPPCPPPMHSVAMPCLTPSRRIALTRCSTMRLPLAPTGWPSPMAPPSTLSLSRANPARGAAEAEDLAAERVVLPGRQAGEHLRGERLVELPQPDVAEGSPCRLQDRGRAQHRAEPHDRRIERRPLAVDDHGARLEAVLLDRRLGRQDHPGGAVGDLRAVAGRHLAVGPLEGGLELGELLHRCCRAARRRRGRRSCRRGRTRARARPRTISAPARGRAAAGSRPRIGRRRAARCGTRCARIFGGLAHIELDHRVGQAALEPDHRLEITTAGSRRRPSAATRHRARRTAARTTRRRCAGTPAARGSAPRRRPPGSGRNGLRGCTGRRCRSTACRSRS